MLSVNTIRSSSYFAMILSVTAGVLLVGNVAQAGLIHHYQAEGNANDSVGSHHGVEADGVGYAASMPGMGQAFSFSGDGNSNIDTNEVTIPESGDRTIAFWMKSGVDQTSTYNGQTLHVPVSQGHSNKGLTFQFGSFGNPHLVYCCRSGSQLGAGSVIESYPSDSVDWHHVAVTYNSTSSENKIYVDGVQSNVYSIGGGPGTSESSWVGDTTSNGNTLRFGTDDQLSNRTYNGLLDDVRVYDSELSAADVSALVPEPTSCLLIVVGLGMMFVAHRRKKS